MWSYSESLRALYETPALVDAGLDRRAASAPRRSSRDARSSGRTLLTEAESKSLLAAYGIPVVETSIAATEDEAVAHADRIGYPVVAETSFGNRSRIRPTSTACTSTCPMTAAVRQAFRDDPRRRARDGFLGVTVQPMISRRKAMN